MADRNPPRKTFPKQTRLLASAEFDAVFAQKQSAADGRLVVYGAANELGCPRLGLVVSRKVGNAVRRNRWKRLLREAFRLSQADLPRFDLVCLPRGPVPTLTELTGSLTHLARRIEKKAARRVSGDREASE